MLCRNGTTGRRPASRECCWLIIHPFPDQYHIYLDQLVVCLWMWVGAGMGFICLKKGARLLWKRSWGSSRRQSGIHACTGRRCRQSLGRTHPMISSPPAANPPSTPPTGPSTGLSNGTDLPFVSISVSHDGAYTCMLQRATLHAWFIIKIPFGLTIYVEGLMLADGEGSWIRLQLDRAEKKIRFRMILTALLPACYIS